MNVKELETTARALVAPGKGILAADESHGTIEKRFQTIGLPNLEPNRRAYRDMLFTTKGFGDCISGVILFDETIRQSSLSGAPFPEVLTKAASIPGIKVDAGTVAMPGSPEEKITQGLDGLRERLAEYRKLGARFAKWRAVITIGNGLPTPLNVRENAILLARYAQLCQEADVVPIVEPEVLMDGDHTIDRCMQVTTQTLLETFAALAERRVVLEGMLLKPNMVVAGKKCAAQPTPQLVAEMTVTCFRRTVPSAVPGIVFLSGGQSASQATHHLSLMNAMGPLPWQLSFSYGRALQDEGLKAWAGRPENVAKAQKVFGARARLNGLARSGKYDPKMEGELVTA
jgi:fructose-bisphosphate aldolase class I